MTKNKAQLQDKADLTVLPGNEKSLGYKILPVPNDRGRFAFTWDVFKNKLGNLMYVNLLMLVFFTPLIAVFFLRYGSILTSGALGAFGDNLGVGYPASPDMTGLAEALMLEVNTLYFALAVAAAPFTAVGLAGGVYAVRKLLRSDDEFRLLKDFFTGVKKGYVASLVACVLSFAMIFVCVRVWDSAGYEIAMGGNVALNIVFRVLACLGVAIVILFSLWLTSVGSNYKQNVWGAIKNSVSLGAGTF
ncbi:MAG: hypothetical protein IJY26_03745, partial [Clostridia bacterium]|nr:hypothetical protein [Clostridia bacterium]